MNVTPVPKRSADEVWKDLMLLEIDAEFLLLANGWDNTELQNAINEAKAKLFEELDESRRT